MPGRPHSSCLAWLRARPRAASVGIDEFAGPGGWGRGNFADVLPAGAKPAPVFFLPLRGSHFAGILLGF